MTTSGSRTGGIRTAGEGPAERGGSATIAPIGRPRSDVLITDLDGDLTLYDPRHDRVHVLNASAGDIWRLLDGVRDLDQVAEAIAVAYSTDVDEVRTHVVRMVAQFVELDLVPGTELD